MDKAEEILMKHVNDNDLNFMFHEQKQMYNEVLNALNEALDLAHVVATEGKLAHKYCSSCGEPIGRRHKFWCSAGKSGGN